MPTTVTASNGNVYHLLQLSTANSVKQFEESIGFSRLRNRLSDGYRSQVLYGSNTGNRSWRLTLPTLAHSTLSMPTVTDINEATVSREEYLWSLFCETQISGEPFVIQSERNGQYYLCEFVDERLTYQGMKIKLYSTGIELEQVRIEGVTVFDVAAMAVSGYGYAHFDQTTHHAGYWADKAAGSTLRLTTTGDVTFGTATQNGLNVVQLNVTTNNGLFDATTGGSPSSLGLAFDVFLVMKMREATFSNNAGILCDTGNAVSLLKGDDTTTKFADLSLTNYRYWNNGIEYADADQQAPMNEYGIVQIRLPVGYEIDRIGKDLSVAGTFAEMDVAEIISFTQFVPFAQIRELTEHLALKWALT